MNIDYSKLITEEHKQVEIAAREKAKQDRNAAVQRVNARLSALQIDPADFREWLKGEQ